MKKAACRASIFVFLTFLSVSPALRAEDRSRAQALQDYNEEVNRMYEPSSRASEENFYRRMHKEGADLENINDYIQWAGDQEDTKKTEKLQDSGKKFKSDLRINHPVSSED